MVNSLLISNQQEQLLKQRKSGIFTHTLTDLKFLICPISLLLMLLSILQTPTPSANIFCFSHVAQMNKTVL